MVYKLEPLQYPYNALEPYMDEATMRIHHDKHHQTYVDKLNAALQGSAELQNKSIEELLKNLNAVPENIRTAVKNFGGGHYNHAFFWSIMKKDVKPKGDVIKAIESSFGSFDKFKEQFSNAAIGLFGSGWAWLVASNNRIEIMTTANQDCPLSAGKVPLLTIDVWEHAYYIKYQNRRADFVAAFFNIINWDKVNEHYLRAKK